jgi:hypothetical protein
VCLRQFWDCTGLGLCLSSCTSVIIMTKCAWMFDWFQRRAKNTWSRVESPQSKPAQICQHWLATGTESDCPACQPSQREVSRPQPKVCECPVKICRAAPARLTPHPSPHQLQVPELSNSVALHASETSCLFLTRCFMSRVS